MTCDKWKRVTVDLQPEHFNTRVMGESIHDVDREDSNQPTKINQRVMDRREPDSKYCWKSVSEYLSELQAKLKDFAESHAAVEQQRYVNQYNRKVRQKKFQQGQQIIVLIPDSTNKQLKKWQGPATIVERKSHSYLIELDHRQRRWLHANC